MRVILLLATGLFMVGLGIGLSPSPSAPPLPTEILSFQQENSRFKQDREAFFEHMHKAAPGVDWRQVEARNQRSLGQLRSARKKQVLHRRFHTRFYQDTVGNGQLIGHWRELGSRNQSGRIEYTHFDPATQQLYAASDGGLLWKGSPDGDQWQVLNDLFPVPDINYVSVISQDTFRRLLLGSSRWSSPAVWYSDDEGLSWEPALGLEKVENLGYLPRLALRPDSLDLFALTYEWEFTEAQYFHRLYRSTDLGTSFHLLAEWSAALVGSDARVDLWTDAFTQGPVFIQIGAQGYAWQDSLQALSPVTLQGGSGSERLRLRGRQRGDSTWLYLSQRLGNHTQLYQSADGGQSWQIKGQVPTRLFTRNSFACDVQDPLALYIGGVNAYRSLDGGHTWALVNEWFSYYGNPTHQLHADITAFNPYFDSIGNAFTLICTDGGVYRSEDRLATVLNLSLLDLNVSQYYSSYTHGQNPEIVYAGAQDQGFQRTLSDNGMALDFAQLISGDYGHIGSGDAGISIWANYPGFTLYFPQAGQSPQYISQNFQGDGHLWLPPLMVDPMQPAIAYRAGGSLSAGEAHIFKIKVLGNSLISEELPYDFGLGTQASLSALAHSSLLPSIWYAMNDNGVFFYSFDSGQNWQYPPSGQMPGAHYFYGHSILPSPTHPGKVYVGGSGYSNAPVFVSLNNGQSFTPMSQGLPPTLVYDLASSPNDSLLFAATEAGPFIYVSADSQWYPMGGISAPQQRYWSVEYVPGLHLVRFASYGRGIWDFVICDEQSPPVEAKFTHFLTGDGQTAQFFNLSSGALFHTWEFSDGTVVEQEDFVAHTFDLAQGTHPVRLIANSFCQSDTLLDTLYLYTTGLADTGINAAYTLFPNPTSESFQVKGPPISVPTTFQLWDMAGRAIFQKPIPPGALEKGYKVQLNSPLSGIYLGRLIDPDGSTLRTWKILIP